VAWRLHFGSAVKEWLVTDRRGAFAMGNAEGGRSRKYHGFFQEIVGRGDRCDLADLEIRLRGESIWPHQYAEVEHPQPALNPLIRSFRYSSSPVTGEPSWEWLFLTKGRPECLRFRIERGDSSGFALRWEWEGEGYADLAIRPFFALRPLHGLGGKRWNLRELPGVRGGESDAGSTTFRVDVASEDSELEMDEATNSGSLILRAEGAWTWEPRPDWYYRFRYSEEEARGYPSTEDLYSAGEFRTELGGAVRAGALHLTRALDTREQAARLAPVWAPVLDFVLTQPAGVVAGYPWFGEWGRDTFIALPGIVQGWLDAGGHPSEVREWAEEVLTRWGRWIHISGMLPNLVEGEGSHQWESADATLWWCHAVAALWSMSFSDRDADGAVFKGIEARFAPTLGAAIQSIRSGSHLFLRETVEGLLEVTEPHVTWMDARINSTAVTPRLGRLPEINALWFQARYLQSLLGGNGDAMSLGLPELSELGERILRLAGTESHRPNFVFLHSIPLAPFFVLSAHSPSSSMMRAGRENLHQLRQKFWTPVGLRTLAPGEPNYRARCVGTQHERDLVYHQGPAWGWLGGHYEMARDRLFRIRESEVTEVKQELSGRPLDDQFTDESNDECFGEEVLREMPIEGQIAEIFDAEEPFVPRGAPAQAWSLACHIEAKARRRTGSDARLTEVLARRWLDRRQRPARARPRRPREETA
jgi:glycogen debranching enzyme